MKTFNALPQEESMEWEEIFDDKFFQHGPNWTMEYAATMNGIKSFIKDILQRQAREIREKILNLEIHEDQSPSFIRDKINSLLSSYLPSNSEEKSTGSKIDK
jgi:hypothetical protein